MEPDGALHRCSTVRQIEEQGLPAKTVDLLARNRGDVLGRFVLDSTPGAPPGIHTRSVAAVLAGLAAAAVADEHLPTRDEGPDHAGSRGAQRARRFSFIPITAAQGPSDSARFELGS